MTASTPQRTAVPQPTLPAAPRSAACGAPPPARVTMPTGGRLFFCAHHANAHLAALVGSGADILDERQLMTA